MSWSQRVFSVMGGTSRPAETVMGNYQLNLHPSLSHRSDWLPEKRIEPAIPLEYRGVHGEYDPQGLAKRVAQAFDQHPQVQQIKTLCIIQHGNKITLLGKVTSDTQLQQVIEVARQVEGTKEVDVHQVVVEESLLLSQT